MITFYKNNKELNTILNLAIDLDVVADVLFSEGSCYDLNNLNLSNVIRALNEFYDGWCDNTEYDKFKLNRDDYINKCDNALFIHFKKNYEQHLALAYEVNDDFFNFPGFKLDHRSYKLLKRMQSLNFKNDTNTVTLHFVSIDKNLRDRKIEIICNLAQFESKLYSYYWSCDFDADNIDVFSLIPNNLLSLRDCVLKSHKEFKEYTNTIATLLKDIKQPTLDDYEIKCVDRDFEILDGKVNNLSIFSQCSGYVKNVISISYVNGTYKIIDDIINDIVNDDPYFLIEIIDKFDREHHLATNGKVVYPVYRDRIGLSVFFADNTVLSLSDQNMLKAIISNTL